MNDRFSMNGGGKNSHRNQRFSVPPKPEDASEAKSPDEREKELIRDIRQRYGEIEDLWEQAEKQLKRFGLYRSVEVRYNGRNLVPDDPSSPYGCEILGWMRFGKSWRICHTTYFDESDPPKDDWRPVVDCPVDVRVEAIQHFEALRTKVVEAAEKCVPKLDSAITNFRSILES